MDRKPMKLEPIGEHTGWPREGLYIQLLANHPDGRMPATALATMRYYLFVPFFLI